MIRFRTHIPTFVEGFDPVDLAAPNQEAFLAQKSIQQWTKDGQYSFHRFSLSGRAEPARQPLLMAEFDEGRVWYVVGYILEGAQLLNLPEWEASEA